MRASAVALLCLMLLSGCAGGGREQPPETVGEVDLQRYQGTWYELARLPMFFQRNCLRSEAHYELQADGSVAVSNRCETKDGDWQQAKGEAVPQQAGVTDRLWVRFDNWFSRLFPDLTKGHYWVLYLDEGYSTALVGSPDRKYLWLLARDTEVDQATRERLLSEAERRGYDTRELLWRQ
ncbi:lipocalin [Pseudomonas stutzeri]|jgi:apolipoprotein D and lipocalin family protein|uniref:Outer membrane lipoprotein Blc n=1 Tax=Stutzerimonas stutzeri NF13 TaxID=1212548 RepID=M2VFC7_STUST|nr:lipocalin family protein [Stutzerimonas stutzeri]EMD98687.1 outer membrane lipoprotein Blc [Stutzerimonas stutzeri NF13]MBK3882447.1 lipocalin [Stutzerimonas stutzeri]